MIRSTARPPSTSKPTAQTGGVPRAAPNASSRGISGAAAGQFVVGGPTSEYETDPAVWETVVVGVEGGDGEDEQATRPTTTAVRVPVAAFVAATSHHQLRIVAWSNEASLERRPTAPEDISGRRAPLHAQP
jgi:hypothetical protein